jgi:hypothetical protein
MKKFFMVKPFLANVHSASSILICLLNFLKKIFLLLHEYPKYAEFHAYFKSVELKEMHPEKVIAINFCKLIVQKRTNSNFCTLFCYNLFWQQFFAFSKQFQNQHKILLRFGTHIKILRRKSF